MIHGSKICVARAYRKRGIGNRLWLDKIVINKYLELAKKYTKSKFYYWNAGEYVWRADSLLEELNKFEPEIGSALKEKWDSWFGEKEKNSEENSEWKSGDYPRPEGSQREKNVSASVSKKSWRYSRENCANGRCGNEKYHGSSRRKN